MTTLCTDKRTEWRAMPKSKDDNEPVSWKCKACGAHLGRIGKDIRGWHYVCPSSALHIRIFGDAEVVCQFCGARCNWSWNEHALKRVLRYREKRV